MPGARPRTGRSDGPPPCEGPGWPAAWARGVAFRSGRDPGPPQAKNISGGRRARTRPPRTGSGARQGSEPQRCARGHRARQVAATPTDPTVSSAVRVMPSRFTPRQDHDGGHRQRRLRIPAPRSARTSGPSPRRSASLSGHEAPARDEARPLAQAALPSRGRHTRRPLARGTGRPAAARRRHCSTHQHRPGPPRTRRARLTRRGTGGGPEDHNDAGPSSVGQDQPDRGRIGDAAGVHAAAAGVVYRSGCRRACHGGMGFDG